MMNSEAYVSEIRLFAHDKIPDNFLPCDGRVVSVYEYQKLYSCIGNVYGGDAYRTFAFPDFRHLAPVGAGQDLEIGNRAWLDDFNSVRTDGRGLDSISTRAVVFCIAFEGMYPTER